MASARKSYPQGATIAALCLMTACQPLTEEDAQKISAGLKNISNAMQERSCITQREAVGLGQINSVLERHKSEHRIVMWNVPKVCGT